MNTAHSSVAGIRMAPLPSALPASSSSETIRSGSPVGLPFSPAGNVPAQKRETLVGERPRWRSMNTLIPSPPRLLAAPSAEYQRGGPSTRTGVICKDTTTTCTNTLSLHDAHPRGPLVEHE